MTESVARRRVWQDGECGKTESGARRSVWQDGECGKTESVARRHYMSHATLLLCCLCQVSYSSSKIVLISSITILFFKLVGFFCDIILRVY